MYKPTETGSYASDGAVGGVEIPLNCLSLQYSRGAWLSSILPSSELIVGSRRNYVNLQKSYDRQAHSPFQDPLPDPPWMKLSIPR